jgi:hypothetical protein
VAGKAASAITIVTALAKDSFVLAPNDFGIASAIIQSKPIAIWPTRGIAFAV